MFDEARRVSPSRPASPVRPVTPASATNVASTRPTPTAPDASQPRAAAHAVRPRAWPPPTASRRRRSTRPAAARPGCRRPCRPACARSGTGTSSPVPTPRAAADRRPSADGGRQQWRHVFMAATPPAGTPAARRGGCADRRPIACQPTARTASGSVAMPGDRGVRERGDQPRIAAPQTTLVHLERQVLDAAVDQRLHAGPQAGRPGRPAAGSTSRTRPSSAGRRTAGRNTARTTASIRSSGSSDGRADRGFDHHHQLGGDGLEHGVDQLVLRGNQYRTVCLRTPTSRAISSSDTASTPRAPNRSSAASRIRCRGRCVCYRWSSLDLPLSTIW